MASIVEEIKTERLILRGIEISDTDFIVKLRSNPDIYKYFKSPHKITKYEHELWFNNSYLKNDNRCDWTCIEKSTCNKVGVFGLVRLNDSAEVNYILAEGAQHKGYATEAINAMIGYAESMWHTKYIVAEIHHDNIPSVSLVKRMGFIKDSTDGVFDIYKKVLAE